MLVVHGLCKFKSDGARDIQEKPRWPTISLYSFSSYYRSKTLFWYLISSTLFAPPLQQMKLHALARIFTQIEHWQWMYKKPILVLPVNLVGLGSVVDLRFGLPSNRLSIPLWENCGPNKVTLTSTWWSGVVSWLNMFCNGGFNGFCIRPIDNIDLFSPSRFISLEASGEASPIT
jgi:hypothetical protein